MPKILLLLLASCVQACAAEVYKADVLILGAGMTGLSAGRQLTKIGINNFLIIEGGNRIGGRVRETKFGGKTVEVGANWIHGTVGNPVFELAQKYGLKIVRHYDYDDITARNRTGDDVTTRFKRLKKQLDEAIEKSEVIRRRKVSRNEPDVTYRSALSMTGWIPNSDIMDMAQYSYFDFECAFPPDRISLKYAGCSQNNVHFTKEDAFVVDQRGFVHILKSMMEEFMAVNDTRLHLNKVVKKIEYSKHLVRVTTSNGDVYEGRFAICTFSIGVLEAGGIVFQPPLPYWKQDVVNTFDMGFYLKIFVKFPDGARQFWDTSTQIYHINPRRGYYSFIQNLEAKNLFPKGTNLLLVTVTGDEAIRVSRVPKSEIIAELNDVFSNLYGKKAVKIEDVLVPDWISNPLQLGMYSSWPIGVTSITFDMLRLPVGGLFFAGEHTSRNYFGYLHGAYLEGIRVANEVFKCKEHWDCPDTYRNSSKAPYIYKADLAWKRK